MDQNGLIITYEVLYEPLQSFDGQLEPQTFNTTELFIYLTTLQEFVGYNISVRAYTSAGSGPYSDEIFAMTLEDSNLIELACTCYHVAHCFYHIHLQILGVLQSMSQLKWFHLLLLQLDGRRSPQLTRMELLSHMSWFLSLWRPSVECSCQRPSTQPPWTFFLLIFIHLLTMQYLSEPIQILDQDHTVIRSSS